MQLGLEYTSNAVRYFSTSNAPQLKLKLKAMLKRQEAFENVGPIRHCEPPHAACLTLPFTRCRTPPLSHAVKIGRSIAEMLQFFVISRWPPPPSWFFEIAKFYWLFGWRGLRRISVQFFFQNRSIGRKEVGVEPC